MHRPIREGEFAMSTILRVLQGPVAEALGWALLHSLWQIALAGCILAVVDRLLRSASANLRYCVLCGGLVASTLGPVATLSRLIHQTPEPLQSPVMGSIAARDHAVSSAPDTTATPLPAVPSNTPSADVRSENSDSATFPNRAAPSRQPFSWPDWFRHGVTPALGWIVGGWGLGVAFLMLRLTVAWLELQRVQKQAVPMNAPDWKRAVERLAARLEIHRPVRLVESRRIEVPSVIGWFRPVILLPVTALTGLPVSQVEALLAHELAHIRRHDYLANLVQTAAEILFFYHPVLWWISRRIREERENCCDDLAVAVCGDVQTYARALASMEELRSQSALSLAANGGSLLQRIRRLSQRGSRQTLPPKSRLSTGGVSLLILLAIASLTLTSGAVSQFSAAAGNGDGPLVEPQQEPLNDAERPVDVLVGKGTLSLPAAPASGSRLDASGDPLPEGVVQRLGTTRYRVPGWYKSLGFSANGDWIWVKSDNQITAVHRATGHRIENSAFGFGPGHIDRLAVSDDGTRVAVAQADYATRPLEEFEHRIQILDGATGAKRTVLKWNERASQHVLAFSRDTRYVACVTNWAEESTLRVWLVETGTLLRESTWKDGMVLALAFSPDGKSVATGGRKKGQVWNWEDEVPAPVAEMPGLRDDLLRFSVDGSLVTGAENGMAYVIRDPKTGKEKAVLETGGMPTIADGGFGISPDGRFLAGPVYQGNEVRLWDLKTLKLVHTFACPQPQTTAFSPDGKWLAAGGDTIVRVWNAETHEPVDWVDDAHSDPLFKVKFLPDQKTLVTASADSTVRFWDIGSGKPQRIIRKTEKGMVDELAISPDGRWVASSSHNRARLTEAATGRQIAEWTVDQGRTTIVKFSEDSRRLFTLATSHEGGRVLLSIRDAESGKVLETREIALKNPKEAEVDRRNPFGNQWKHRESHFVDDGARVLLVNRSTIYEIESASGNELAQTRLAGAIEQVAVSPDSRWVAMVIRPKSTDESKTVYQLQLQSRDDLKAGSPPALLTSSHGMGEIAFSADSRQVAWYEWEDITPSSVDLVVADIPTGTVRARIRGARMGWCLEFSPNGQQLATGHYDSSVVVWDLSRFAVTGKP
jgi:WD40 repeat protein/beta-lactamase regulating signal transducer with metallopeptidase domain